ncbi:NF038132 family protein [Aquabacterium sp. G14]|uniref:NF038132 family protein n=1 Tax=Aquabacterium sp. G14 TaxID=3130164 RepID=UPI0030DB38D0
MMMSKIKASVWTLGLALGMMGPASAALFDAGLPAGWTANGNAGTLGANGVVTLAPSGGSQYGYVSSNNGVNGVALPGVGGSGSGTNGSTLRSAVFSAAAGDDLEFFFNYVTSDGAGFADYAWARLLDSSSNQVALLFTARTAPSGSIVPGFSMPAPAATLSPASVTIIAGGPSWSPLGGSSGSCYSSGCGYTGWVQSNYEIATAGNYVLEFGVTNWSDTAYDSGLAFDGITVGGVVIGEPAQVSEPAILALMGLGLVGAAVAGRRRQTA